MAVYNFYSIIHQEDGVFAVTFPDLENCLTYGDTLDEAVEMAHDALLGRLTIFEDFEHKIPEPSKAEDIQLPEGARLILVEVNTDDLRENLIGYFFKDNS
jgi:predicted RNase H-like HicB family nuclease